MNVVVAAAEISGAKKIEEVACLVGNEPVAFDGHQLTLEEELKIRQYYMGLGVPEFEGE